MMWMHDIHDMNPWQDMNPWHEFSKSFKFYKFNEVHEKGRAGQSLGQSTLQECLSSQTTNSMNPHTSLSSWNSITTQIGLKGQSQGQCVFNENHWEIIEFVWSLSSQYFDDRVRDIYRNDFESNRSKGTVTGQCTALYTHQLNESCKCHEFHHRNITITPTHRVRLNWVEYHE